MAEPQPFDPGYDYEADKDICERLKRAGSLTFTDGYHTDFELLDDAAGEIRALRLLIKNMEKTINNLVAERNEYMGEDA